MSRQKYEKTFNTFTKGLMTEASELNFPEDFSLYEKNFLLHRDGGRSRRKGLGNRREVFLTSNVYEWEAATSGVYEWEAATSEVYELPPPEPVVYEVSVDPELIGITASFVSGVFRSSRQELEIEPERVGVSATLIEGSFNTPKVELSVEPESMSVEATFVEGSLVQSPVYRAPALSVSISMNIIGGSHE